jgi:hypothetical protein
MHFEVRVLGRAEVCTLAAAIAFGLLGVKRPLSSRLECLKRNSVAV